MQDNTIHFKGSLFALSGIKLAIVGSRKMTERGEKLAYEFSSTLASKGFVIVSGLARGIDTIAHTAALDAGGTTVAVLGSGFSNIYPPENTDLVERISTSSGLVVSQFADDEEPHPGNFLARNKLIAELSHAVVVIEGQRRSGTLSTASWAGNLGRDVFAVPGSPATDWLIEEGAKIATTPMDIVDCLNGLDNS